MRSPQFRTRTLLLGVATIGLWLSVFHSLKPIALLGLLLSPPALLGIIYILLIMTYLPDGPDKATIALFRAYLWISIPGVVASILFLAIDGLPFSY
jgi:Na+-driven multidrug efflux pump